MNDPNSMVVSWRGVKSRKHIGVVHPWFSYGDISHCVRPPFAALNPPKLLPRHGGKKTFSRNEVENTKRRNNERSWKRSYDRYNCCHSKTDAHRKFRRLSLVAQLRHPRARLVWRGVSVVVRKRILCQFQRRSLDRRWWFPIEYLKASSSERY